MRPEHQADGTTAPTAVGVFYDGEWLLRVSDYYAHTSRWRAALSIGRGMHDAFRWWIHGETGQPVDDIQVTQAHYVRGRSVAPSTAFDRVLADSGVIRHDAQLVHGGEKGADVELALEAWVQATTARLDWVVLFTGDSDFVPLATRLAGRGVQVLVPEVHAQFLDQTGDVMVIRTSQYLSDVTHSPPLDDVLSAALEDSYPLQHPFVASPAGVVNVSGGSRYDRGGVITRWHAGSPYGFITDRGGRSWFASVDDVDSPDCDTSMLHGARVRFSGSSSPAPGKRYPRAYTIRLVG